MEQAEDQNFLKILDELVKQQQVNVNATNGQTYAFKALTTKQLKSLLQSMVDTSLNDISFNNNVLSIVNENFINTTNINISEQFNIIDRILFLLQTRCDVISNKVYMLDDNDDSFEIDLQKLVANLTEFVKNETYEKLSNTLFESNGIKIVVGIPTIKIDVEIANALYRNVTADQLEETEALQTFIGDAFLGELTKWIVSIDINSTELNYRSLSYNEKIKILETLPATLVEKVIEFVEKTKSSIQNCITVSNKILPLNSTLFSVR